MPTYTIYVARWEDLSQGWVWIGGLSLPHRSVVKLSALKTGKSVYCEVLSIDDNFLVDYNETRNTKPISNATNALVAAEWYRSRLGIKQDTDEEIEVEEANCIWGKVRACLHHPQIIVRLSVKLALWSVALGLLGVVLGAISLIR